MRIKKQQLEQDMEQQIGSKLGKGYIKAVYCHPAYLTYMQSTSWETLGWLKHKLESSFLGEMSTIWYANHTTLMVESEEELKSFLRVKEESEKADLKLNIKKTKVMASNPITSWQTEAGKVGAVTDFLFLGSKITADDEVAAMKFKDACSLEEKIWQT